MNILVTGGAGYIGSHTVIELLANGHTVVIVDNLLNSSREAVRRVEKLAGTSIPFYELDIRDKAGLDRLFKQYSFDAVMHFAGLKAVGESVRNPLSYYDNNVIGSTVLMEAMANHGVQKLVFSSSATVYGSAPYPYIESSQTGVGITNPYGQTKYMVEQIMQDTANADPANQFVALRYFNPVGAHPSGDIGEDPSDIPNNLMPYIAQVAVGRRSELAIFGNDYDTPDGTGVRDYIHVVDLARGHVAAVNHLQPGFDAINLGSGKGTSVLEMVHAFEKACGKPIPYKLAPRRAGDLAEYYADANKAKKLLGWQTELTIDEMCADTWNWQSKNPNGYSTTKS